MQRLGGRRRRLGGVDRRWPISPQRRVPTGTAQRLVGETQTRRRLLARVRTLRSLRRRRRNRDVAGAALRQGQTSVRTMSARKCSLYTPAQIAANAFVTVKFHYAVWSRTGRKLVADLQRAGIWPII